MRAIVQQGFGGPEVLRLEEVAQPEPIPTEVLVRVHAAGVNPVDWKSRQGGGMASRLTRDPVIPGWDVAGVVEAVGFGVTHLAAGDAVYGMPWFPRPAGAYAEYVTAPSRYFARAPRQLDHVHAAAVPLAGLTAWQALVDTAHVTAGQRVLVHAAAGGVGHLAVQFANHLGAVVIATAQAARHDWLRSLGADEVVDYTAARFEEVASDVDVVIDLVGQTADTDLRSVQTLRPGGLIVSIPGGVRAELAQAAAARGVGTSALLVEPDGHQLGAIAGLIDDGAVRIEVERVFPLAEAAAAHEQGEQGRTRGKLVLDITR